MRERHIKQNQGERGAFWGKSTKKQTPALIFRAQLSKGKISYLSLAGETCRVSRSGETGTLSLSGETCHVSQSRETHVPVTSRGSHTPVAHDDEVSPRRESIVSSIRPLFPFIFCSCFFYCGCCSQRRILVLRCQVEIMESLSSGRNGI